MRFNNDQSIENILNRLKRVEGQIRGVQKMVAEERDCQDIFQQLTAVKSALNGVSTLFLKEYVSDCVNHLSNNPDQNIKDDLIKDLVNLVGKAS